MIPPFAIATSAVASSLLWTVAQSLRRPRSVDDLVKQIEKSLAGRLHPFVAVQDYSAAFNDKYLLQAIGGTRGILQIYREAGILASVAIRIGKQHPEDARQDAQRLFYTSVYLRVTVAACLVEAALAIPAPWLPRIQARGCARLYCEIAESIDAMLSTWEPCTAGKM